jgi:hypothetical protein
MFLQKIEDFQLEGKAHVGRSRINPLKPPAQVMESRTQSEEEIRPREREVETDSGQGRT